MIASVTTQERLIERLNKLVELLNTTATGLASEATLASVLSEVQSIDLNTDGLEGLATSLNGFVDGLETLVAATNTLLTTLSTLDYATESTLSIVQANTVDIYNTVDSKMHRIAGAANYNRAITYIDAPGGDFRVSTVVHTGTTNIAAETITETFTYYLTTDNVTNILYS